MVSQLLIDEQGTLNIIPKKANIDLKRAIQPKLEKL
jgi:coiled-coil domain-containing protein 12